MKIGDQSGRAFQHEHFEHRVCQPYGELREFQKKSYPAFNHGRLGVRNGRKQNEPRCAL